MNKKPLVLFFFTDILSQAAAATAAQVYTDVATVYLRFSGRGAQDAYLEQCDYVAGDVPANYAEAYPNAAELLAGGTPAYAPEAPTLLEVKLPEGMPSLGAGLPSTEETAAPFPPAVKKGAKA
jgi:hypothetical protein